MQTEKPPSEVPCRLKKVLADRKPIPGMPCRPNEPIPPGMKFVPGKEFRR